MASEGSRQPAPIMTVESSTRSETNIAPSSAAPISSSAMPSTVTPTTLDPRMNPPAVPRSQLGTPTATPSREGEGIIFPATNSRKPRQNLDENDHIAMLRHCYEHRDKFKDGTKMQFWTAVAEGFQRDTGKTLAQLSATVARLLESRRRQINDWERGIIPSRPGGELNDAADAWMEFLRVEDAQGEAERMATVDARRKLDEKRKEARRQSSSHDGQARASAHASPLSATGPVHNQAAMLNGSLPNSLTSNESHASPIAQMINGHALDDEHGLRPQKRRRVQDMHVTHESNVQGSSSLPYPYPPPPQHHQLPSPQVYAHSPAGQALAQNQPKRVVVEGALSKDDWRDIMGSEARIRTLESKIDRIELLVSQNSRLLLQLLSNSGKERARPSDDHVDGDADSQMPVHLDADFDRDYL